MPFRDIIGVLVMPNHHWYSRQRECGIVASPDRLTEGYYSSILASPRHSHTGERHHLSHREALWSWLTSIKLAGTRKRWNYSQVKRKHQKFAKKTQRSQLRTRFYNLGKDRTYISLHGGYPVCGLKQSLCCSPHPPKQLKKKRKEKKKEEISNSSRFGFTWIRYLFVGFESGRKPSWGGNCLI